MAVLIITIAVALAYSVSNGFHDSANAIAALVATRAATPARAVLLAGCFEVIGPLVVGTAVADTVGGIVVVPAAEVLPVVGAALTGALAWNLLTWWRGIPSSSSHALIGGLVGAALLQAGGGAVHWGGVRGAHPTGVVGVLIALAVSPLLGLGLAFIAGRGARRALRRARRSVEGVVRRGEWITAATLAFSHGANDAQKGMGVITLLLLSTGHLGSFTVPLWVKLATAAGLTCGVTLGGWRIVRTVGRGIYRIRPLDGLVSQGSGAVIILGAAALGGPVSTTHVVASSVMGLGAGQRWRHVRWAVVREIAVAWLTTLPVSAALAAATLPVWRAVA